MEADQCVHGNPIDAECREVCEHGVQCGLCDSCEAEYFSLLDKFCRHFGEGDARRGARRVIKAIDKARKEGERVT